MDREKYFDKIDQYLTGSLSASDRLVFELEIEKNQLLKQDVEEQRLSHEAVELIIEDRLRSNFAEWKVEKNPKTQIPKKESLAKRNSVRLAIAAAILALLSFSLFKWFSTPYSNDQILVEYYQPFIPSDLRTPETTVVSPTELNKGLTTFEDQDFKSAIEIFSLIPDTSTHYQKALYALAHSYYASEDYELAAQNFKASVDSNDIRFREKAEWYLLLSYLAMDQIDGDFSALLDLIASDTDHSYNKMAKEIKEKMRL